MALHWEFSLFLALAASLFFYGFHQSRIQLTFLLISTWIALLLTLQTSGFVWNIIRIPWFTEEGAAVGSGILFLVMTALFHIFFRVLFKRQSEAAIWWQVLMVAFLETGMIAAILFTLFHFDALISLSGPVYALIGSKQGLLVWLFLPLFGILLLAKKGGKS